MLPPAVKNNQNEFCIFVVSAWGTKPQCFFFFWRKHMDGDVDSML